MNHKLIKKPYSSYNRARDLAPVTGLKRPVDGYTPEEIILEKLLTEETIQSLYAKLPTNELRFIVAAHFELGYPLELVADILGIKYHSLRDKVAIVQRVLLGKPYRRRDFRPKVTHEDILKVMVLFTS